MTATRLCRSVAVVLLTIFIDFIAFQPVHGFLFTPKFQIYLNALRGTQHEFVFKWDGLNNHQNNGAGFSYATNQNGKFDFQNIIRRYKLIRAVQCVPYMSMGDACFFSVSFRFKIISPKRLPSMDGRIAENV